MLWRRKALFEGHSFQVTVLSFFEILQKFFFPLLAMTFLLLIEKIKVDAATIKLLGTPQMICTTSAGPCSPLNNKNSYISMACWLRCR